jgi:deoxyribodipyrimidine photolyase-related protein
MEISLLFPHQLFKHHPATTSGRDVYLFEDPLFFTQYSFHKHKLILHRASMKYVANHYEQNGFTVNYISCQDCSTLKSLFEEFKKKKVEQIHLVCPEDYLLERRLKRFSEEYSITLCYYDSPMFLLSQKEVSKKLGDNRHYFMANFYKKQRQDLDILMDNGNPRGGKWSFDDENRKKLPKDVSPPPMNVPQKNDYLKEAIEYVNHHFGDNPGNGDDFLYPVTWYQAEKWLEEFLDNRMNQFGDYEDAISQKSPFLFHSVLTPSLNTGLLTPQQVLDETLSKHGSDNFPINSLEGFIRQIIGWREFMRGIYVKEGVFERTNNHFGHKRKIPDSFWSGETGIPPIDDTIKKVLKLGYCHHIERLMILGNFMLLCEFDPDEVYRWFMELFVDSYDWVMVPNVYGMIMYADNGLITTKPYTSGSNYIRKMSHYGKGEWCDIWDGLYWRFMHLHQEELSQNHRMNMIMGLLGKMNKETLNKHLDNAESYLDSLS